MSDETEGGMSANDKIVDRAQKAFARCKEWESEAQSRFIEDVKFANADPRNMWQWPEKLFNSRDDDDRPCLTINKTRTHNRMIINETLKNKQSIKIRPTGGGSTYEAAKIYQALVRRIEYISSASAAYATATKFQVEGGVGYVTLETAYTNDKSFDQDIYLRGCKDPRGVYLDPDIKEEDGSDANFGIIFSKVLKKDFNVQHPEFKDTVGTSTLGQDENWMMKDHVLVAKYYERQNNKDILLTFVDPNSKERFTGFKTEVEPDLYKKIIEQIQTGQIDGDFREVTRQNVKWYLIGGDQVLDKGDWAGRYIPIARQVGEETIIEGKLDRKGHTRMLIDPQRMLNYNASGQVEFGALQNKVPYTGAADAFEGQEEWKDANKKNYAFLQFNHLDDAGEPIPPQALPQRQQPPQTAPVYAQGMQDAEQQMMMASGQYQAQMGENENAKSGKAINERQQQGDTATYHFVEGQWNMLRYLGKQIVDLIPHIYDTKRILHIIADDGTEKQVTIDPDAKQAYEEVKTEGDAANEIIFNPNVGEYEVISDPGPNYATQRQEAWNAISMILQQNIQLGSVIGDLLFKFGDFPGADELMKRLQKEIKATKPYLFDDDQNPGMVALQQQIQKLSALNGELMQKLAEMSLKLKGKEEQKDINAFDADTKRMKITLDFLLKSSLTPAQQTQLSHELEMQTREHVGGMIMDANRADLAANQEPASA